MALVSLLSQPGKLFSNMTWTSFIPYREGCAQRAASSKRLPGHPVWRTLVALSRSPLPAVFLSVASTTTCHTRVTALPSVLLLPREGRSLTSRDCPVLLCPEHPEPSGGPPEALGTNGPLKAPCPLRPSPSLPPANLQNCPWRWEHSMVRASNTSATSTGATEHLTCLRLNSHTWLWLLNWTEQVATVWEMG